MLEAEPASEKNPHPSAPSADTAAGYGPALCSSNRRRPYSTSGGTAWSSRRPILVAAAAGQWEQAVDELIIALHARAETALSKISRSRVPCWSRWRYPWSGLRRYSSAKPPVTAW
jgi:hypothetical protein